MLCVQALTESVRNLPLHIVNSARYSGSRRGVPRTARVTTSANSALFSTAGLDSRRAEGHPGDVSRLAPARRVPARSVRRRRIAAASAMSDSLNLGPTTWMDARWSRLAGSGNRTTVVSPAECRQCDGEVQRDTTAHQKVSPAGSMWCSCWTCLRRVRRAVADSPLPGLRSCAPRCTQCQPQRLLENWASRHWVHEPTFPLGQPTGLGAHRPKSQYLVT